MGWELPKACCPKVKVKFGRGAGRRCAGAGAIYGPVSTSISSAWLKQLSFTSVRVTPATKQKKWDEMGLRTVASGEKLLDNHGSVDVYFLALRKSKIAIERIQNHAFMAPKAWMAIARLLTVDIRYKSQCLVPKFI